MSDDVLLKVDKVSKRFCRSLKRSLWYGMQDLVSELGGHGHGGGSGLPQNSNDVELRADEFWAVRDVSFELRRGECLGLIGRNGAGKTTLLRMLNGLIKPDTGRIESRGQVGALIALGAGFNPLLTGRENIYINASLLGIEKRMVDRQLDEIINFAELEAFADSPVQTYSSGMTVRLGFAIATTLNPDILILDEVLAVGDQRFRAKCLKRIDSIRENTATIFVSHDIGQIRHICDKGLLLAQGLTCGVEPIEMAIQRYEHISASPIPNRTYSEIDSEYASNPTIKASAKVEGRSCEFMIQVESLVGNDIVLSEIRVAILANQSIIHVLRCPNISLTLAANGSLVLAGTVQDLAKGHYDANLFISRNSGVMKGSMLLHAFNVFSFAIAEGDAIGYGCSHISQLQIKTHSSIDFA